LKARKLTSQILERATIPDLEQTLSPDLAVMLDAVVTDTHSAIRPKVHAHAGGFADDGPVQLVVVLSEAIILIS
jgi:hypothetical protein